MLRLKHNIIDGENCYPLDTREILGANLTKAFANIKHTVIVEDMDKLGIDRRTYEYVRNFLTDLKATLAIGGLKSATFELGSRGTPQGSVLSPFVFSGAIMGLPKILDDIKGLRHSLYAGDIML